MIEFYFFIFSLKSKMLRSAIKMIEVANQRLSQTNKEQIKEPDDENQLFEDTARPKHVLGYVPPKSNYMPNQVN